MAAFHDTSKFRGALYSGAWMLQMNEDPTHTITLRLLVFAATILDIPAIRSSVSVIVDQEANGHAPPR